MNPDQIIDALGGTNKVAELCNLTASAISQWRVNGIPAGWLKFLQTAYPKIIKSVKKGSA